MILNSGKSGGAKAEVKSSLSNMAAKPSIKKSLSEKMHRYKERSSGSKKDIPNISSMVVSSTDTTISTSTTTTRIDAEANGMEILLQELDKSHDIGAFKDEDNEEVSIASSSSSTVSRYFERTDFMSWEELYSTGEYAPHVGFAIAAGSFAFLHPIVFFAGVVTAVGAARAAGATYEYAMCIQQGRKNGRRGDDSSDVDLILPCDCLKALGLSDTLDDANLVPEKTLLPFPLSKIGDADSVPAMMKSDSTCSTNASTVGDAQDDMNGKTKVGSTPTPSIPTIIESPRRIKSPKGTFDSSGWVRENFPTLPIIALENVEFRGLNAHEFFDVFFADDAPFGFPAFHILRRDKEVEYSPWNTGVSSDEANTNIEIPPFMNIQERKVQYHAKTNSFLGPAYALTKKLQRAFFVSKKMLVIEIKMTLHDIPFSKQFYLIERWVIDGTRSQSRNEKKTKNFVTSPKPSSSHCVYLTVSSEVCFTQECSFESTVRKESTKQVCEISKCWNAMAQAGLKRTEETRTKRLRQEEEERERSMNQSANGCKVGECIEIEHLGDSAAIGRRVDKRRRSSIRGRRRSSTKAQKQPSQGRVQNRRLSQSFSKLLNRGSSSNLMNSAEEFPKVRISSQGIV